MDVTKLIEKTEKGDPEAMWELAEAYFRGEGVVENDDKAFELYKKLEDMDPNQDVLCRLGQCYFYGFGVNADSTSGIAYFKRAADKGNGVANRELGCIYRDGKVVNRDTQTAINYLLRAVELGNSAAMVDLGDMHHSGDGVEKDESRACQYYKMAVDHDNRNACYRLGMQTYNGWGVTADKQLGLTYWMKGADLGHCGCQYILGVNYLKGDDVPQDTERGIYWLQKSADRGLDDAQLLLGRIYLNGMYGVTPNETEGVKYLSTAAEANQSINAMIGLGNYYMGKRDGESIEKSAQWYEKAADHDVLYAVHMAASAYEILALASSATRRNIEYGYMFSRDDWKKVVDMTQREITLIQNGTADEGMGNMADAVSRLNQAKYEMAICCYELKDYATASTLVADSKTPNGQLLYAVIINQFAKGQDMVSAIRLLANAFVKAGNATNRTFEEEKYFVIAAVVLSDAYRNGLAGFSNSDMNAAIGTLNAALKQLKNQTWIQYVSSELAHYKPKMFGGYKYV